MRRGLLALLALTTAVACGPHTPHPAAAGGIARPLTAEQLTAGQFVAYTLTWQVAVPGGDPIVFRADGNVENQRAGLAGTWRLIDDTTLSITPTPLGPPGIPPVAPRAFVQRRAEGDLAATNNAPYWIRRAGSANPY